MIKLAKGSHSYTYVHVSMCDYNFIRKSWLINYPRLGWVPDPQIHFEKAVDSYPYSL